MSFTQDLLDGLRLTDQAQRPAPLIPAAEFARIWADKLDLTARRHVLVRYSGAPSAAGTGFSEWESTDVLRAVGFIIEALGLDPDALLPRQLLPHEGGGLVLLLVTPLPTPDGRGVALKTRIVARVVEGFSETELNLALAWWGTHAKMAKVTHDGGLD